MNWIKYIFAACLALLLLSVIGFAFTFSTYGLDRYKTYGSPYDLNEEYNVVLISRLIRTYAGKVGIDDDSWVLTPVKSWHKKAYKKAMKVIPESDGERLIWESDYKINSYETEAKRNLHKFIKKAETLKTSDFNTIYFNEIDRYALMNGVLRESINNHQRLDTNQKKYLIDIAFDISKAIDTEKFTSESSQELNDHLLK